MVTWAAACAFWFATNVKAKTFRYHYCYDDACTGADGGVGVGSSTVVAVVVAAAAEVASVSVLAAAFCCCCS